MGWRLGGKCATARGPNARIEEHGIHGFLGCHYNALPLMADCYKELARQPGQPLATFEEAFHPGSFMLMWEFIDGNLKRWPFTASTNDLLPSDPSSLTTIRHRLDAVVAFVEQTFEAIQTAESLDGGLLHLIENAWEWLQSRFEPLIAGNDELRRLYILTEFLLALVRGTLADNIFECGFDVIDNENFSDWLQRHGASVMTTSSPLALNTVNLSYQYPDGDTARTALMGAGCYLNWTLRSFAYMGAFAWLFEAGTGETVIAPLYEVLKKRGVKFEFFHKVESLELSADKTTVGAVNFGVQATLRDAGQPYQPLMDVQGLTSWPGVPHYGQLVEGDALKAGSIDLESYWTPWQPVAHRRMEAGRD